MPCGCGDCKRLHIATPIATQSIKNEICETIRNDAGDADDDDGDGGDDDGDDDGMISRGWRYIFYVPWLNEFIILIAYIDSSL